MTTDPQHASSPRFAVGEQVRISNVGCDCDGTPATLGWCYRHDLVGATATIIEAELDETVYCYSLDIDNEDVWYSDELEPVAS